MHQRTLIVLPLALVLACAAAEAPPPAEQPGLAGVTLRTASQTLSSYTVVVTAAVTNPRPVALQLTKATYVLTADDQPVREGEAPLEVVLAPGEGASVDVPVAVEYAPTLADFESGEDAIRVVFDGRIFGRYGDEQVEVPVVRAGAVRSPRLPQVKLGTPDAARQRIDAIAGAFFVDVANENPFEVKVKRLDYVLEVEGNELSAGSVGNNATIPPSSTTEYEVDVGLTEETVPGIAGLMKDKNALDYRVHGALWVGDLKIPYDLKSQIAFTAQR